MIDTQEYPIPAPSNDYTCSHSHGKYVKHTYADGSIRIGWECASCFQCITKPLGIKRAIKEFGLTEFQILHLPLRMIEIDLDRVINVRRELYKKQKQKWWSWYNDYLSSLYWLEKREAVLKRDNNKCCICGGLANQVHHLTYQRVGNELLDDLISICAQCHTNLHQEQDKFYGRDGSHRMTEGENEIWS